MNNEKKSSSWGIFLKVIIAIASALIGVLGGVEATTLMN
jgi:hypothetical protein